MDRYLEFRDSVRMSYYSLTNRSHLVALEAKVRQASADLKEILK